MDRRQASLGHTRSLDSVEPDHTCSTGRTKANCQSSLLKQSCGTNPRRMLLLVPSSSSICFTRLAPRTSILDLGIKKLRKSSLNQRRGCKDRPLICEDWFLAVSVERSGPKHQAPTSKRQRSSKPQAPNR